MNRREGNRSGSDGDRVTEIHHTGILGNRRIKENGNDGTLVDLTAQFRSDTEDLGLFSNYILFKIIHSHTSCNLGGEVNGDTFFFVD